MRIGIDEAGRGSLIGPMVVAGVVIDDSKVNVLKSIGVRDSKQLSRQKREKLFSIIVSLVEAFSVVKVFPEEIDRFNLNDLTYSAVIKIIYSLSSFSPYIVTVDKVGSEKPVIDLILRLGYKPNVVHKADENFIESSTASIIAKVIRDRYIESFGIKSAIVKIIGEVSMDDIEKSIFEAVSYKPAVIISPSKLNIIDLPCITLSQIEVLPKIMFEMLEIIRVYTKEPGEDPTDDPLIMKRGSTVLDVAKKLHSSLADNF
ncbi:hypothetical protein DJ531_08770, partial [Sulfolobus sp. A20-N-F6]